MKSAGADHWEGDRAVSLVLRIGVILAATLVVLGGTLYLIRHGHEQPRYGVFQEESAELRHLPGIFRRATSGSARGLIQLGLLVLIGTPVARVVTSLILFIEEKDRTYVLVTAAVLVILLAGWLGPSFL